MALEFERYLNIRSAYAPAWLEDGERVAFLTDITGTPQVWSVTAGGGWPDQLSFFQDKVWTLSASPKGDRLVCSRDVGGNERYQLFLISADGAQVRRLTHDDGAMHHFGGWSHDGMRIAYASNARDGVHFDIYVLDVDQGEPQMVYQSEGSFRAVAWSPDDSQLLLSHEVSSAQQPLYVLNLSSGEARPLSPTNIHVGNRQARWVEENRIYLLSNLGRDTMGPAKLNVKTGEITYLTEGLPEEAWDAESLAAAGHGRTLAYTINEGGYTRLKLFDLQSQRTAAIRGLPDGVVAELTFAPDGRYLAVSVQSPAHNLDIWEVDTVTLGCEQITHSSLAGIPRETLVEPELIEYETFDGRMIPAFLYRPSENRRLKENRGTDSPRPKSDAERGYPVILYVHGGPASQILPDFDPRFQFFLGQGYAILATNVRGSSGYGAEYMALDDVRKRMDSVTDLKYAVEWLRESGVADPKRIAIYGRSYGGFMVLAAVTTYPDLWAAAIDVVGIGNWVGFLEKTGSWRRAHREKEYGSLEHDREFLESISPIHKVDAIEAPMLVVHGANDPRVPIAEADGIVESLRARGRPVEYLRYEDEGHKISKLANRIDSFTKMAAFLAKYLG